MNRLTTPLPVGTKVRTCEPLQGEDGLCVERWHLRARRPGASGTVSGILPVHDDTVYLVQHVGGGDPGAYRANEIELEESGDDDACAASLAA